MIDISYKLFDLIVRTGNLSKAAEVANLSPSAVSHSLKKLERNLDVQLFNRNRDGVQLTDAGRQLLPYIRAAISAETKLDEAVFQVANIKRSELSVGIFYSIGVSWIPDLIRILGDVYPELVIRLEEGYYKDVEEQLLADLLDVAFVSLPISEQLQYQRLMDDRLLCIAPGDLRTENPGYITIEELAEQRIIRQGINAARDTDRFLRQYGLTADTTHTVYSDAVLVRMVESGLGVAIMPELALEFIPQSYYQKIPIEHAPIRTIGLATSARHQTKESVKLFSKVVADYVASRYPEERPYFR